MGSEPEKDEIKKLLCKVREESSEQTEKDSELHGTIDFNEFLEIMAIKMSEKDSDMKIADAFKLFCEAGTDKISLSSLREVAIKLWENMTDEELKEMILEANKGQKSLQVGFDNFKNILGKESSS